MTDLLTATLHSPRSLLRRSLRRAAARLVGLALLGLLLAACALPARPAAAPAGEAPDAHQLAQATLTAQALLPSPVVVAASPTFTPVVVLAPAAAHPTRLAPLVTNTALPDPIRFTFPTQASDPVSLWRAPLYPVPWEPGPYDHFYFTRPIGADEVNWPLARYRYGYLLYSAPHTGIDIPAPKGTNVLAAGDGTVIWSGYGLYFMRNELDDPYGIAVAIRHDFGYDAENLYTIYGHMDQTYVYRGQRVQAGETIGLVGETGKVSGPHLHFEVRLGQDTFFESRNPELWIAPPTNTGVLVGRVLDQRGDLADRLRVRLFENIAGTPYEIMSYAKGSLNSDEYYRENLVLGDLPAGEYTLYVEYESVSYKTQITINPGQVTFFTYSRRDGFSFDLPRPPGPTFIAPDATPTGTP